MAVLFAWRSTSARRQGQGAYEGPRTGDTIGIIHQKLLSARRSGHLRVLASKYVAPFSGRRRSFRDLAVPLVTTSC